MISKDLGFFSSENEKGLFKNQVELVKYLLDTPESPLYQSKENVEEYLKAQNRLKTYVSQLLSESAYRPLNAAFEKAVKVVIMNKKNYSELAAEQVVKPFFDQIIKKKRVEPVRIEEKSEFVEQFKQEFDIANYVVLITAKPLVIDREDPESIFTIKNFLADDLIKRIMIDKKFTKKYRFNFPLSSSAALFWRGLEDILSVYFLHEDTDLFIKGLLRNGIVSQNIYDKISGSSEERQKIIPVVREILEYLNANRFIQTFFCDSPIFSLPTVALDPSTTNNFKIYALLRDQDESNSGGKVKALLHKYTHEDSLLWRIFVWDKIKTFQYAGTELHYKNVLTPKAEKM